MLIVDFIVQVLHHLEKKHLNFIDQHLLEFASMIGMPLDEDLQNSSEISIINKAVDYLDAKRAINKSNKNVVLKREKI